MKDVACGWCNAPGNQKCIEKKLADQGKCKQNEFIHAWNDQNNFCPKDKNKKNENNENVVKNISEQSNQIPIINPKIQGILLDELTNTKKELSELQEELNKTLSSIENVKKELEKLEKSNVAFEDSNTIEKKIDKTEEEINKGKSLIFIERDYLYLIFEIYK